MVIKSTIKRRIYVSHEENMRYWGGKLPTWRNAFCYIERSVTPVQDAAGIWDNCVRLKTPSGAVVIVDGEEIVGRFASGCCRQTTSGSPPSAPVGDKE